MDQENGGQGVDMIVGGGDKIGIWILAALKLYAARRNIWRIRVGCAAALGIPPVI
jgi:hypothetical protein